MFNSPMARSHPIGSGSSGSCLVKMQWRSLYRTHETAVLAGVTLQAVQAGGGASWHTAAPRDEGSCALIAHSPLQALDMSD